MYLSKHEDQDNHLVEQLTANQVRPSHPTRSPRKIKFQSTAFLLFGLYQLTKPHTSHSMQQSKLLPGDACDVRACDEKGGDRVSFFLI